VPVYQYTCPVCGPFEKFSKVVDQQDHVWHNCPGFIGGCLSTIDILVCAIEPLENCGKDIYNPMTGARMEHGFWNHMVSGPRGDGYFHDRAEYKKWMKSENLEEAGPGAAKAIINKVMDQRKINGTA